MHWFKNAIVMAIGTFAAAQAAAGGRIEYPNTPRGNVVETLHGIRVADPYRWLETDIRQSKEVADWVAAENKVTSTYLASIPQRESIRRRLTELWNFAQ
jgi:prolyl oligopeptidase